MTNNLTAARMTSREILAFIAILLTIGIASIATSFYCFLHGTIGRYGTTIVDLSMAATTSVILVLGYTLFKRNKRS